MPETKQPTPTPAQPPANPPPGAAPAAPRTPDRKDAEKRVDDESKARHDANVEAGQRNAKAKPTPTQRESDLAKLGALDIDDKEDDGSGPDPHALQPKTAGAEDDASKYKTRDLRK